MQRYKGSIKSSTAAPTSNISASGIWTLTEQMQAKQASAWPSAGTGGSIALNGSSQYLTATAAQSYGTQERQYALRDASLAFQGYLGSIR